MHNTNIRFNTNNGYYKITVINQTFVIFAGSTNMGLQQSTNVQPNLGPPQNFNVMTTPLQQQQQQVQGAQQSLPETQTYVQGSAQSLIQAPSLTYVPGNHFL